MTDWWFVRHGESVANAAGWLSGWDDVELTPAGLAAAFARAPEVAALPLGRCLTSDLRRARSTALALLGAERRVPLHVDPALRERHLGAWQGQPVARTREPEFRARLRAWHDAPPGGETHCQLVRRTFAALRRWDDGTPTLVVAHGALIRDVLGVIDGREPPDFLQDAAAENVVLHHRRVDLGAVHLPD